jgi:NADH:ubiquinone reductase (H+-translocating)
VPPVETNSVVIVGAGFGGLRAAQALARAPVHVTIVDRSNHHLFQPLLYQVATAALSPADIAAPIRGIIKDHPNVDVLMAELTGIDLPEKKILTTVRPVPFDYLILATGARYNYFGHDDWEANAPALKTIPDAIAIREKILRAFEAAEAEEDSVKRAALLTFVLVGGGPTGVEMAGAIAELAHRALASDFRRIDPRSAQVVLLEAGPKILASFPDPLVQKATAELERLGVRVRTSARVESVTAEGVMVSGSFLPTKTVIWAAGVVVGSPLGNWLGAETDRSGRVKVAPDLSVPGHPEIFVIGDACYFVDEKGKQLPGVAPVAMQQGRYVGSLIKGRLEGKVDQKHFHYWDKGNLATVGRSFAIADLGKIRLSGLIAWLAWIVVHIYYLIGFRNRTVVLFEWAWAYFTFQRGARLITGNGVGPEGGKNVGKVAE